MIPQIFLSEHGAGDILKRAEGNNSPLEYLSYIGQFFDHIKRFFFGEAGIFVLIFLSAALLILYINRQRLKPITLSNEIIFLIFTALSVTLFIAVTGKYQNERYVMNLSPIYAVIFLYFFLMIYRAFFENIRFKPLFIIILFGFMLHNHMENIGRYLYNNNVKNIDGAHECFDPSKRYNILQDYRNNRCVYVYDANDYFVMPRFGSLMLMKEFSLYSSVDFVEYKHFIDFLYTLNEKTVTVYFCSYKKDEYDGDKERIENLLRNAVYPYKEITSERGFPVYELDLNR